MMRNCNLELRLFPSSDSDHYPMMEQSGSSELKNHEQQPQQLTIFYNGKTCVSDVTELQARTILFLANREMEERTKTPTGSESSSPALMSPVYAPTSGLCMKRSLQHFLQKRKHRIHATLPYNRPLCRKIGSKFQ